MANTHTTLTSLFTAIADKIRTKIGSTEAIVADNFPDAIDSIVTLSEGTADGTASAGDILSGKTAYVDGVKITGTIATKTSSDLTVEEDTVNVPAGYYASSTYKRISSISQAVPRISVDSSGLITASSTQSAGYVSSGTKNATKQLSTQAAKTITPSTSSQTAVASGVYTTGAVTVAGDSNLVAENIKSGVSIFDVEGSLSSSSNGSYTLVNGSSTAIIEFCGNWLDPGQTIVTPVPAYSAFSFNGIDVEYSSRIQIIIPNGSSLVSSVSCILTDNDGASVTNNIESSKFYNMGTNSYIGTFYVLATTNVGHVTLYPLDGNTLTIIAN